MEKMTLEQIEKRFAEIKTEVETADEARVKELEAEIAELETRRAELEVETRRADILEVIKGAGNVVAEQTKPEVRKVVDSEEYMGWNSLSIH